MWAAWDTVCAWLLDTMSSFGEGQGTFIIPLVVNSSLLDIVPGSGDTSHGHALLTTLNDSRGRRRNQVRDKLPKCQKGKKWGMSLHEGPGIESLILGCESPVFQNRQKSVILVEVQHEWIP